MSSAARVGVGTRFVYEGETVEIVEMHGGKQVTVRGLRTKAVQRLLLRELLDPENAHLVYTEAGPASDDDQETAAVKLAFLTKEEREEVVELADHVREVLTGFRSGSAELARPGEPKPEYHATLPLMARYAAKAAELNRGERTIERWVHDYQENGDAGLIPATSVCPKRGRRVDQRWVDTCAEIMVESVDASKPSEKALIRRTNARAIARFGEGEVTVPPRTTAYRVIWDLEATHPLIRHSTIRNRDIADRPAGVYGKLRPTRPGEYTLMDTTRLDVHGLDPMTLRWVRAELTVTMDWYSRCITGLCVTPVSTKSMDAARALFWAFRPPPAGRDWPANAVWPEHGIPRAVWIEQTVLDKEQGRGAASPAIVPETMIVDHGRIFVSAHFTSVCERLGISVQPARLRKGRDKGPVERFFDTLREDLLQYLPGYKGSDLFSRGLDTEGQAFYFLDQLETLIREWIAVVYHNREHSSLIDPAVPGMRMSPAEMFEHGVARAGYIEAPRDRDLAFEFLPVVKRTIQDKGVEIGRRFYSHPVLVPLRHKKSPYRDGKWPISYNPDNITRAYFRHPVDRRWRTLVWEDAPMTRMPYSADAANYARRLASEKFTNPSDQLALEYVLQRWHLGLADTMAERGTALRIAREQDLFIKSLSTNDNPVMELPAVRAITSESSSEDDDPDLADLPDVAADDDLDEDHEQDDVFFEDADFDDGLNDVSEAERRWR